MASLPNNYNNSRYLALGAGGATTMVPSPQGAKPNLGIGPCSRAAEVFTLEQLEEIYDALQAIYNELSGTGGVALRTFRDVNQLNVGLVYNAAACSLFGWNIINPNAEPIYVKFYDKAVAPTATDTPIFTLVVPTGPGGSVVSPATSAAVYPPFAAGISIRATKGLDDTNNTPPESGLTIDISFK